MFIRALSGLVTRAEKALNTTSPLPPNRYYLKDEITKDILYKSGSSTRQYMSRFAPFRWLVSMIVDRAVETAWNRIMRISG